MHVAYFDRPRQTHWPAPELSGVTVPGTKLFGAPLGRKFGRLEPLVKLESAICRTPIRASITWVASTGLFPTQASAIRQAPPGPPSLILVGKLSPVRPLPAA